MRAVSLILLSLFWATTLHAQDRRPSHCIAIADALPEAHFIHKAAFDDLVSGLVYESLGCQ